MKEREILDNDLLVIENDEPNYVELISANSASMLNFMKITLRQNDIHFFVKNEMMLQAEPFLAAVSTVDSAQIMVRKEDSERAIQILEDNGHSLNGSGELTDPIGNFVNSVSSKIPFLKDLRFELQMIAVLGTTAILFAFAAFSILNALGLASY